jgi:hypothetical protein
MPQSDDVILVADVDEIVKPDVLLSLSRCQGCWFDPLHCRPPANRDFPDVFAGWTGPAFLYSRFYNFRFEWEFAGSWKHPQVTCAAAGASSLRMLMPSNDIFFCGIVNNVFSFWINLWYFVFCSQAVRFHNLTYGGGRMSMQNVRVPTFSPLATPIFNHLHLPAITPLTFPSIPASFISFIFPRNSCEGQVDYASWTIHEIWWRGVALQLFQVGRLAFLFPDLPEVSCDAILSGTEGVIAKIEAFAHQEFNNDGAMF